jgi:glycosyltransferase involved in cell wall biosynthesis
MDDTVDIAIATYNSEAFIREQLDSLVAQTHTRQRWLIRDDGSADDTVRILGDYLDDNAMERVVLEDDLGHLGACMNFSRILGETSSDYVMCCDHDDVWLPEKIEKTLKKMKSVEQKHGRDVPAMIHTDMKIVSLELNPIAESYRRYQKLPPKNNSLNRLLVQNVVSGCTVMVNRALMDLAMPLPPNAIMHDHWFALVAAALGVISYIPEPTMLYRQHAGNYIGAQKWGLIYMAQRMGQGIGAIREGIRAYSTQAEALLEHCGDRISDRKREVLEAFACILRKNLFRRRVDMIRYGLFKSNLVRNLGMFIAI